MTVLLCAATGVEARACVRGIEAARAKGRFEILRTGMGLENAKRKLEARLRANTLKRPELVISTGFAGSWSASIRSGAWALGQTVELEDGQNRVTLDQEALNAMPAQLRSTWVPARILSLQAPKTRIEEAQTETLATLVDMESHALACVARAYRIPCSVLRLVTDSPAEPMPKSVSRFAQAALATSAMDRLTWASRGLSLALYEPAALARFVKRSAPLPGILQSYWTLLAQAY